MTSPRIIFAGTPDFAVPALQALIDQTQQVVNGTVRVKLYKGNVTVVGRESTSSLYDRDLSSMDIEGGFNQQDSQGFIEINAIRYHTYF